MKHVDTFFMLLITVSMFKYGKYDLYDVIHVANHICQLWSHVTWC